MEVPASAKYDLGKYIHLKNCENISEDILECYTHEAQGIKRRGYEEHTIMNDNTNITHEITAVRTKKNCNKGTAVNCMYSCELNYGCNFASLFP